jgi:hypothetical protein
VEAHHGTVVGVDHETEVAQHGVMKAHQSAMKTHCGPEEVYHGTLKVHQSHVGSPLRRGLPNSGIFHLIIHFDVDFTKIKLIQASIPHICPMLEDDQLM